MDGHSPSNKKNDKNGWIVLLFSVHDYKVPTILNKLVSVKKVASAQACEAPPTVPHTKIQA